MFRFYQKFLLVTYTVNFLMFDSKLLKHLFLATWKLPPRFGKTMTTRGVLWSRRNAQSLNFPILELHVREIFVGGLFVIWRKTNT